MQKKRLPESRMPEEDMDLVEEEDNLSAGAKISTTMKRETVQKLQYQLKNKVALEEEGLTNEERVMAEAKEMPNSVTSGDTGPLNVLKTNKLGRGEHILLSPMKRRYHHRRWRICQKLGKPWY